VAAALSGDLRGRRAHYRRWRPALLQMDALAAKLRTRRARRGALEMELPEAKVLLDRDDPLFVRDIVRAKGAENEKRAYHLVEEFMIAANEAVGAFFRSRGLPTVWRVHAAPKRDRVESLAEVLSSYGISVDVDSALTPQGMQQVLDELAEHEASRALTFLLLRTLKQAAYSTDNVGHFGLASEEYLHFTSPIRRYPDLLVHRLLKYYLHGEGQASGGAASSNPLSEEELRAAASDASSNERRALEVEREAVSMYRAYLMRDQLGEQMPGTISGVTGFGAFVEIDDPFVEGLIRTEALGDDHFELAPSSMRLVGRKSGVTISLGDRVVVEVAEASVPLRRVDFRLVEPSPTKTTRKGKGGGRAATRAKGRRRKGKG
jgi:ribonuclease R